MAWNNRSVLEKADLTLSELTAENGVLQPKAAQKFMRLIIEQGVLLKQVTAKPMSAPKEPVHKIGLSQRVLRPGRESTALTEAERAMPDFGHVELDAKLFKGQVNLSDEVLEDNIERGEFRQTLMTLIAEAVARDMEDLVINGDAASPDPFLSTMNGVLAQTQSHVVDAAGARVSKDLLHDVIKSVPSRYRRDKRSMRLFTSADAELDYRQTLAERATAVGDKFLEGDTPVMFSAVPLVGVPLFPENLGPAADQTSVLLCNPKNIHLGMWRRIKMEQARDIERGVLKVVVTLRFDAVYLEEEATAKIVGVQL